MLFYQRRSWSIFLGILS